MEIPEVDAPRIVPSAGFQRPDRLMPADMAMDVSVFGIVLRPLTQKLQAFLSLAKFIVEVTANMSGVPIAWIAVQCRLDVAKAVREVLKFDLCISAEQAVDANDIGVAGRRRACRQRVSVSILKHATFSIGKVSAGGGIQLVFGGARIAIEAGDTEHGAADHSVT